MDLLGVVHVLVLEGALGGGFAKVRILIVSDGTGGFNRGRRVGGSGGGGGGRFGLKLYHQRQLRHSGVDRLELRLEHWHVVVVHVVVGLVKGRANGGRRGSGNGGRRDHYARLVGVEAIVRHDGITLRRSFYSLLHGAIQHTTAVVLTRSAGALHGLLTILAPEIAVFILIHLASTLNDKTLLRSKIRSVAR